MRHMGMVAALIAFTGTQQIANAQEEAPKAQARQYDLAEAWDEFDTIMRDVEWYHRRIEVIPRFCETQADAERCMGHLYAVEHGIACVEQFDAHTVAIVPPAGMLALYLRGAMDYASNPTHPLRVAYARLVVEIVSQWPLCHQVELHTTREDVLAALTVGVDTGR